MAIKVKVEKNNIDSVIQGKFNDILVVGGAGHIGLPLSLFLFSKYQAVTIFDISTKAVSDINKGKMPFVEHGCEEILKQTVRSQRFHAINDLSESEGKLWPVAIIIIGTQLLENQQPDRLGVFECVKSILGNLQRGALLILRSTIYPGTTVLVEELLATQGRSDIRVVFAPERIAEGFALEELQDLPQIVGSNNKIAGDLGKSFFISLGNVVVEASANEAEIIKLLTNVYRFAHFAIANALYLTSENLGFNYSRIFKLMTDQYPRLESLPKPGYVGGPCLIKDSIQLNSFIGGDSSLIQFALKANRDMVDHTVAKTLAFRKENKQFVVGVIGLSFKPDIDDFRDSPIVEVMRKLKVEKVKVFYSDPYVQTEEFDKRTIDELQEISDVILIGTLHSDYKGLQLTKPSFSVWN
jgi:UDP-N-acetyl-D-mannosaminuronic acid dehydrogenase